MNAQSRPTHDTSHGRTIRTQLHELQVGAGGLLLSTTIRQWMGTLDYRVLYHDPATDPAVSRPDQQRYIYVFWHEYILAPLYLRGHCDLCMLLSPHRDANLLARVAEHMGFSSVRGSSNRQRVAGLRQMLREGRQLHLTLTPDGPRGPRRQFSAGAIYLASRLQIPIIGLGFGFNRPWRLNSWDRFAIPRLYSRARCVVGPPVTVPPRLNTASLARWQAHTACMLNDLTVTAERWAHSRQNHPRQIATHRRPRDRSPQAPDRVS